VTNVGVTLRPYRAKDQESVVALWWNSWHSIRCGLHHPQPFSEWQTRWANEIVRQQTIVVAEDDGIVVGFSAADVAACVLTQIFVDPSRKGQGVGRLLLAWARRLMPDGFCLWTLADNIASRDFYERHGFTVGRTRISSVNGLSIVEYCSAPLSQQSAPELR
jgi:ribosomal protein S18 acetylase RimI-like enzyme